MYIKKDRKLVYTKLDIDINIIKLSSIYTNNCSETNNNSNHGQATPKLSKLTLNRVCLNAFLAVRFGSSASHTYTNPCSMSFSR